MKLRELFQKKVSKVTAAKKTATKETVSKMKN